MKINVYNKKLEYVTTIENNYISCLWREGYNSSEPFVLELPAIPSYISKIKPEMFLKRADRETIMVIKSTQKTGNVFIVSGQQATRLLDDIVFPGLLPHITDGTNLIDSEIIYAYNNSIGKTNKIEFEQTDIPERYNEEIGRKSILELMKIMCKGTDVGFKIKKDEDKLKVKFFKPTREPVKFSEFFGNMVFDNVTNSTETHKNCIVVVGTDVDGNDVVEEVHYGEVLSEDEKKCLIIEAGSQQRKDETLSKYTKSLRRSGFEELVKHKKAFSIDITNKVDGFGKSFDLGTPITIIISEYDLKYSSRIVVFEEKSQNNEVTKKITIGDLVLMR
jgi:hypothetical protein